MSKFEELQQSLGAIEVVKDEVTSIKKDIQAQKPKEKLELRSLDSYPFNVKLTDYWNDEKLKDNYEITDGSTPDAESQDGQVKVWKLDPNETTDFSSVDIKKSFVPESKSKKKVLTEDNLGRLGRAAAIVSPIVRFSFYMYNTIIFISVTDENGNKRTPEKGEIFVGKIIDLEEPKYIQGGTVVTLETKNGEIVKFQYETIIRANVGENN